MEDFPELEECEILPENEAINYLTDVVNMLEKCSSCKDTNNIYFLLSRIAHSYTFTNPNVVASICRLILERNLFSTFCDCLSVFNGSDYSTVENVTMIYTILINFADYSEKFSNKLSTSEIFIKIVDIFLLVDCSPENYAECDSFILMSVQLISNVARYPQNIISYKLAEIKGIMKKCLTMNSSDSLKINSLLLLSYLVEEAEVQQLDQGLNIISNLINHIKYINESNNRLSGFTLGELVHGLHCISTNDSIKLRIVEEDGIPLLIDIIKDNKVDAFGPTLGTIENLCFDDKIRQILKNDYLIEEVLKPFENSECKKMKRAYEAILWKVNNKGEAFHQRSSNCQNKKYSFDVFFSYSWANKNIVSEICSALKSHNYRVWIDEEQMQGSSIEAMANGIEDSKLFIPAISSSYKKSENCRHEAEYALQIKKTIIPIVLELKYKPMSWLGFIMGMKVYYEFSERRDKEEQVSKLIKSIQWNLEEKNEDAVENIFVNEEQNTRKCHGETNSFNSLDRWNEFDVMKWLDDCQLSYFNKNFAGVDGSLLQIILQMRLASPEYFNNTLKNEFGMKFLDIVKFHKALNTLNTFQ